MSASWRQAIWVGAVIALGILAVVVAMRATPPPWQIGR